MKRKITAKICEPVPHPVQDNQKFFSFDHDMSGGNITVKNGKVSSVYYHSDGGGGGSYGSAPGGVNFYSCLKDVVRVMMYGHQITEFDNFLSFIKDTDPDNYKAAISAKKSIQSEIMAKARKQAYFD